MDMLGRLLLVFLAGSVLPVSHHFPLLDRKRRSAPDLPWATPCAPAGSSGQAPGAIVFPFQPPMSDLVNELYIRSQEGHILSGNLKNHFFVHRIDSSLDIAQYLEKVHLNGQPLPGHVMDWNNKNETGDVLITDFINLSTVLVFLEQILVDDLEHENSSSQTEMKTLENKLFSILCQTETILQTLGLKVPSHVTRDVMDNALRDVKNTADRRKRDYTMAKDAVHLMKANEDNHIKMKAAYN